RGGIQRGAMPALHRYLGNPILTKVGRMLFRSSAGDFHCGLRAFRKDAYVRMGLRTTGMEFASEMVVKATLFKMRIAEVPTTLSPDGRSRPPHLRTWRDGWRHLRFLFLYSPRWLFLYPDRGRRDVRCAHTSLCHRFRVAGFPGYRFRCFHKNIRDLGGLAPARPDTRQGLPLHQARGRTGLGRVAYSDGSWCVDLRGGLLGIPAFRRTGLCPDHATGNPGVIVSHARRSDGVRQFLPERAGPATPMTISEFDQFADTYDDDLNRALSASGETKEFFARGRVYHLTSCLRR